MKKFFLFVAMSLLSVSNLFAQTDITEYQDCLYAGDNQTTTLQQGATGTIELYANVTMGVWDYSTKIQLPDGIRIIDFISPNENFAAYSNLEKDIQEIMLAHKLYEVVLPSGNGVHVGTLKVSVDENVTPGTYELVHKDQLIQLHNVEPESSKQVEIYEDIVCKLEVQRPLVFSPMPVGYGVEIIPTALSRGENTLTAMIQSPANIATLSFDVELPEGLYFMNPDWEEGLTQKDFAVTPAGANILSMTMEDARHAKISYSGTYSAKTKKWTAYLPACAEASKLVTFGPVYIESEDDVNEFHEDFIEAGYIDAKALSEVKISNIQMSLAEDEKPLGSNTAYEGDYLATIFFGKSEDKDPILYGHYTNEAVDLLDNVSSARTIDMSAATIDTPANIESKINNQLLYVADGTKFVRTTTNKYGTICVPFELTSTDDVKYYSFQSKNENTLTFSEVATVNANIPALFEVVTGNTIKASTNEFAWPETAGSQDGFVGTYEEDKIVEGYYIGNNKFWSADGTEITIPAFRAYFEGTVAGVKAFNIAFDEETGLRTITVEGTNDINKAIYDLNGRKINKAAKGVNIVNGKKYLVK